MADILKRPFRLAWRQDAECDCMFGDLFVNGLEEIKIQRHWEKIEIADNDRTIFFNGISYCHYIPAIEWPADKQLVVLGWRPILLNTDIGHDIDLSPYFSLLTPKSVIQKKVAKIEQLFQPSTIGIHIRMTDHTKNLPAFSGTNVDIVPCYLNVMRDLLKNDPNVNFFLATDDPQIQKMCIEEFGDKIIHSGTQSWPIKRKVKLPFSPSIVRSHAATREALIDMLLLSKTRFIIGGIGTFGRSASIIGRTPFSSILCYMKRRGGIDCKCSSICESFTPDVLVGALLTWPPRAVPLVNWVL